MRDLFWLFVHILGSKLKIQKCIVHDRVHAYDPFTVRHVIHHCTTTAAQVLVLKNFTHLYLSIYAYSQ